MYPNKNWDTYVNTLDLGIILRNFYFSHDRRRIFISGRDEIKKISQLPCYGTNIAEVFFFFFFQISEYVWEKGINRMARATIYNIQDL